METLDNMEYRISTITAIAKLNTLIILEKLYNIFQSFHFLFKYDCF